MTEILYAAKVPQLCQGYLYEPVLLYSTVSLPVGGTILAFDEGTFRNNEDFNIHLTHLKWAIRQRQTGVATVSTDERQIQRVECRLNWHDTYYQSYDFMPVPLWHTQGDDVLPDPMVFGQVNWRFLRPFLVNPEAIIEGLVSLENEEDESTYPFNLALHGKGLESGENRIIRGTIDIGFGSNNNGQDADQIITPYEDLSNEGDEPIMATDLVMNLGPLATATDPTPNYRNARASIRCHDGSTGFFWNTTPGLGTTDLPPSSDLGACLDLWGVNGSRGVTHRLPGGGWVLMPGRGFTAEVRNRNASGNFALDVTMAALGFRVIQ